MTFLSSERYADHDVRQTWRRKFEIAVIFVVKCEVTITTTGRFYQNLFVTLKQILMKICFSALTGHVLSLVVLFES